MPRDVVPIFLSPSCCFDRGFEQRGDTAGSDEQRLETKKRPLIGRPRIFSIASVSSIKASGSSNDSATDDTIGVRMKYSRRNQVKNMTP